VRAHNGARGREPDDPSPDDQHVDPFHPAARYCE
jgi:hypothetical protein